MAEIIGFYQCIFIELAGVKNFYCGTFRTRQGVILNEWDTDTRFAMRFKSESAAKNLIAVCLKDLDGCKVEPHPNNIKTLGKVFSNN